MKESITPAPGAAIRIGVPRGIAGDFEKMQKITKEVLGRLGCTPCHSGWDLFFVHENEFVVNAKGEVAGGIAQHGAVGG